MDDVPTSEVEKSLKIFGLTKSATIKDIKKMYHKLALENHPDKIGGNGDKFKEIHESYVKLLEYCNRDKRNYGIREAMDEAKKDYETKFHKGFDMVFKLYDSIRLLINIFSKNGIDINSQHALSVAGPIVAGVFGISGKKNGKICGKCTKRCQNIPINPYWWFVDPQDPTPIPINTSRVYVTPDEFNNKEIIYRELRQSHARFAVGIVLNYTGQVVKGGDINKPFEKIIVNRSGINITIEIHVLDHN
jgi:hypothetical protein